MNEKYISSAQALARQSYNSQTGKKELLIKRGMALAMKKGIAKTSINDITKACNVAKGTFYYYFENKEEFIKAVVMGFYIHDAYNKICALTDTPLVEKIRYYNLAYAKKMYDEIGWEFCHVWSQIVIQYQSRDRLDEDLKQMESILKSGIETGELKADTDCGELAWMMITYVYGAAMIWHICNEDRTVVQLVELFNEKMEAILSAYLQ